MVPAGRTNRSSGPTTVGPVTTSTAAEHDRRLVRDPEDLAGGVPADDEGDDGADRDQATDDDAGVAQLARREVEAAFEQDQRDRQRDQREQRAAEQLVGLDDPGDRAEQQPGDAAAR